MLQKINMKMSRKGQTNMNSTVTALLTGLIVVVMATALAPDMFTNISDLEGDANVPSWVPTVMYLVVGAGLVFLIWNVFLKNK